MFFLNMFQQMTVTFKDGVMTETTMLADASQKLITQTRLENGVMIKVRNSKRNIKPNNCK